MLDWRSLASIAVGMAVAAVYFYLFHKSFSISRRLPPGAAQALLIFGYLGRLTVVGCLLIGATYFGDFNQLTLAISFMVSFTGVFIYTQGRAVQDLMTGRLLERKE